MSSVDLDDTLAVIDQQDGDRDGSPEAAPSKRKRWLPEASAETAAALRRLAVSPWLIAGRDDEIMAAIRRNLPAIRETLARLGWVLVAERDFIRLRKSPPVRREAWSAEGPTPLQASWFFLLVAGAESVVPRVALSQLVMAARAAAAEAGLPVNHDIAERRAIVRALRMLDDRGIVTQMDGDIEEFVEDENAPVLLAVHHSRLAHVIAHFGPSDPVTEPALWLEQVEREPDPARRMRRRLVDDAVVHVADLDDAEADWLSRRVRGDDGGPLATAFGLRLERRAEGAAFVVPNEAFRYLHELGPTPFPAPGTVPHAALLLSEHAAITGLLGSSDEGPGPGWRGLQESNVREHLAALAAEQADGRGGWRRELAEDPQRLAEEVRALLSCLDLLRVREGSDGSKTWWFSPATGRWSSPSPRAIKKSAPPRNATLSFDFGPHGSSG
jgi:uncharacterized protein (TIGR02678 family)